MSSADARLIDGTWAVARAGAGGVCSPTAAGRL
jgi:hypothetical protein